MSSFSVLTDSEETLNVNVKTHSNYTLPPTPYTLDPKPYTLLYTLDPKPYPLLCTLDPKPYTLLHPLSPFLPKVLKRTNTYQSLIDKF